MQHNHLRKKITYLLLMSSAVIAATLSFNTLAAQPFQYDDELIKLAREFEDPAARYLVGRRFHKGVDYPQDKKLAAHWYQLAASSGHIKAQFYLGKMYLKGDGIQQNYDLGKKYLKQAANNEHLDSMVALGDLYRLGIKGKKINVTNAVFWYKKAAKYEHPDAAYYLGTYLYEGRGVAQQKDSAIEWLQLSAELGLREAEKYLERISNQKHSDTISADTPANNSAVIPPDESSQTVDSDSVSDQTSQIPYKLKQSGLSSNLQNNVDDVEIEDTNS